LPVLQLSRTRNRIFDRKLKNIFLDKRASLGVLPDHDQISQFCISLETMLLRPAAPEDIPAIVNLERLPESSRFVGQWSEERHRATLAGPDARYFVVESETGELCAFAILRGLAETSGSIELKRLVVHPPGRGLGRQILAELIRMAFEKFRAHRLFLDVFDDNPRAHHLYHNLGFVDEGLLREAALRDGVYCSLRLMSLLDREYASPTR
jgi:diamine N-acetyltransferase